MAITGTLTASRMPPGYVLLPAEVVEERVAVGVVGELVAVGDVYIVHHAQRVDILRYLQPLFPGYVQLAEAGGMSSPLMRTPTR